MICRRCLLRATRSQSTPQSFRRQFNASSSHPADVTNPPPSSTSTSSTATEPFATPVAADPTSHGIVNAKKKKEHAVVKSTVPAGTVLKGINYLKNKSDPVAMEDSEYPPWLWDILKSKSKDEEGGELGDLYCKLRIGACDFVAVGLTPLQRNRRRNDKPQRKLPSWPSSTPNPKCQRCQYMSRV